MRNESVLTNFELIVLLSIIRLGDDAYGVPISREIEQRGGREVAVGTMYAALDRLERKGFVSSVLGEPTAERGGRAKKYFTVTGKGLREARDAKDLLTKFWTGLSELGRQKA